MVHCASPARMARWSRAIFSPRDYPDYLGEIAEDDSYLKSAYYRPHGYPDGVYRVGPLARLNLVMSCGTPRADHELGVLRAMAGSPLLSSFHYHQARFIEMIHCVERMEELLNEPDILSHACPRPGRAQRRGRRRDRRSAARHPAPSLQSGS